MFLAVSKFAKWVVFSSLLISSFANADGKPKKRKYTKEDIYGHHIEHDHYESYEFDRAYDTTGGMLLPYIYIPVGIGASIISFSVSCLKDTRLFLPAYLMGFAVVFLSIPGYLHVRSAAQELEDEDK